MIFDYKPFDGVLHSFYNSDKAYYKSVLTISSDSNWLDETQRFNAFDFDDSTEWYSSQNCEPNPWLSFCFHNYQVKLTGFEIKTSDMTCRPDFIMFGGSNDNKSYSFQSYSVSLEQGESAYNDFPSSLSDYFRCFKYIGTKNSDDCSPSGYRTDIAQIEIFGILRNYRGNINCITIHPWYLPKFTLISFDILFSF